MTNRIAVACSAAICLALIFTPSTLATITDDIDPQGAAVLVSLSNPGASLVKGWVIVTADLQVGTRFIQQELVSQGATRWPRIGEATTLSRYPRNLRVDYPFQADSAPYRVYSVRDSRSEGRGPHRCSRRQGGRFVLIRIPRSGAGPTCPH